MRKLYISVPMKDRTDKAIKNSIKKMKKLAEIIFNEKFEVIDTYVNNMQIFADGPVMPIYMLGECIKKLSEAEVYIGCDVWGSNFNGCVVENTVVERYGREGKIELVLIPEHIMRHIMPDIYDHEEIMPIPECTMTPEEVTVALL